VLGKPKMTPVPPSGPGAPREVTSAGDTIGYSCESTFERPADRDDLLLSHMGEHRERHDPLRRSFGYREPAWRPSLVRPLLMTRDRIVDARLDPAASKPTTHAGTILHLDHREMP
jgi:hypothetical protein